MTTHIFYLRHGRTELNASHKTRGASDIPLDSVGIKQAIEAGKSIAREGGVDIIYSSPLTRIWQTAENAAKVLGINKKDIKELPGLNSLDYGDLEGKDSALTDKVVVDFIKHHPFEKIGSTGETFQNFKKRFLKTFLETISENKGKRILLVASSSGDRLLRSWLAAGAKTTYEIDVAEWSKKPIDNGQYHHWHGIWSKDAGLL